MSNIYQDIWDADQSESGVKPVLQGHAGNPEDGYVTVNNTGDLTENTRVIAEVVIPPKKRGTYERVRALFDNYALDERAQEIETAEERAEVHELLDAVVDTAPMQVARSYIASATGTSISLDRWYATLLELWFRRFSQKGDRDLSGFEHVFVGEQEGAKVQGYHFWYKYYLDDGLADHIDRNRFPGLRDDRIVYLRGKYGDGQERFPESVTISYKWDAADYDAKAVRPLTKPTGGFFVGCSVEGLMALGAVRAHRGARAPKEALINGARYDLKLYLDEANQRFIRTFYPMFLGASGDIVTPNPAPGGQVVAGEVKILAALVNPRGDDTGKEKVTLINVGSASVQLVGWKLSDRTRGNFAIPTTELAPGVALTLALPRGSIALSNKGGEIRLEDADGKIRHLVSYSKSQARAEGQTIVF
ncbi:MAG: hypothetical protein RL385_5860 [Pseudomonadota bacterium]